MAPTPKPSRILHGLAAAWVALAALPALSQTLGDIDVRSASGEPLDATIALGTAAGAPIGTECVYLSRGSAEDGPFITRANVAVYEDGGARYIRLKSVERVTDAKTRLRVVIQCSGQPHVAYREYRALFTPAPALSPVTPPAATPRTGAFPVRPGDSLESLATLLFPRQRDVQRAYIEALRERNPSLAGLGPRDPIAADAAVELPDLRALPKLRAAQPEAAATPPPARRAERAPPAPARAPSADVPPRAAAERAPRKSAERPALVAPPKRDAAPKSDPGPKRDAAPKSDPGPKPGVAARRATDAGGEFALRLSSPQVDLTRSRGIDDTKRAQLRERLLVLDNDDQVAALLSLRDSMKRLEGRVAELQLKLSAMPASMPTAPRAEPAPGKVEVAAPKPEVAPPQPVVAPQPPAAVSTPAPIAAPRPEPKPAPTKKPAPTDWGFMLSDALWVGVALLVLLAIAFAWYLVRRRHSAHAEEALPEISSVLPPPPTTQPRVEPAQAVAFDVDEPVVVAGPPATRRREMASDASLATQVPVGDPAALRRRYIEQRFPEIANGTIVFSNPDSVVKSARLFYEDGALSRAAELLQFATEENPAQQKPWLALFEIFRLERLKGQFADLAQRFRDQHGQGPNWRKVQFFGREVDPGNALYRDLSVGIETIKFEAGKPPAAASFDPVAENWLNAPMDFENEMLVIELRRALMDEAKITDEDLAPDPMPALRSVEMFTVA